MSTSMPDAKRQKLTDSSSIEPTYNDNIQDVMSYGNCRSVAIATIYFPNLLYTYLTTKQKWDVLEFITLAIDALCTTLFTEDPNAGVGDELNTLTIARILDGFDRRDITMHKLKNNNCINFDWIQPLMHRLFIISAAKDLYIKQRADQKRKSAVKRKQKERELKFRSGEPADYYSDFRNKYLEAQSLHLIPNDLKQSMLIIDVHHVRPVVGEVYCQYYIMQARTLRYPTNYVTYTVGDPCFDYTEKEIRLEHLHLFLFHYNILPLESLGIESFKVTSTGIDVDQ